MSLLSLSTVYSFPLALRRASVITLADVNTLLENVLAFSGWTAGLCTGTERQWSFRNAICIGVGKSGWLEEG